jgi:hypothetical protein
MARGYYKKEFIHKPYHSSLTALPSRMYATITREQFDLKIHYRYETLFMGKTTG